MGVIYVVRPTWLEDCDREKKEIPVQQRYIAYDLVLPKGLLITIHEISYPSSSWTCVVICGFFFFFLLLIGTCHQYAFEYVIHLNRNLYIVITLILSTPQQEQRVD